VGTSPYTTCWVQVQANGVIRPGKSDFGKREIDHLKGNSCQDLVICLIFTNSWFSFAKICFAFLTSPSKTALFQLRSSFAVAFHRV
jgi:hypothetical protein